MVFFRGFPPTIQALCLCVLVPYLYGFGNTCRRKLVSIYLQLLQASIPFAHNGYFNVFLNRYYTLLTDLYWHGGGETLSPTCEAFMFLQLFFKKIKT